MRREEPETILNRVWHARDEASLDDDSPLKEKPHYCMRVWNVAGTQLLRISITHVIPRGEYERCAFWGSIPPHGWRLVVPVLYPDTSKAVPKSVNHVTRLTE